MARTYKRGRGGSVTPPKLGKSQRYPTSSKKRAAAKQNLRARILRGIGVFLLCCVVAGLMFAAGGYLALTQVVRGLEAEPVAATSHPTYIYSAPLGDTDGSRRVIGTIFEGENRKAADLDEMPTHLLDALVAKEDERFREHSGVDLWGVMRAVYVDIRAGEKREGASTITQQYVKNAYLTHDQTWSRKLKEAAIALEVERRDTKDEILGKYLNTVYFGSNAYGVGAAAETYFNKSVEDLTIGESATLIGLLWSPSTLMNDREAATEQRNLVLNEMWEVGYITRQDRDEAVEEELPEPWPNAPMIETGFDGPAMTRNFAEYVRDRLIENFGAETVLQGGLSVYTTLDLEAQMEAQEIMYGPTGYIAGPQDPDGALVSIEPETGQIEAMVGNRDPEAQFNLVTQGKRQPGSSFKTFALIAALEQGLDPETTRFVSEKKRYLVDMGNGRSEVWKVENFEEEERGPITLEEALWQSDNSVFTDLVMNVNGQGLENGPEAIADVARRLGVEQEFDGHPSIVLGAQEVSPLDMATAYATIANGGKKVTPYGIERVVQNEGQEGERLLWEAPKDEGEQVIEPEVAREATEVMIGNITNGIAGNASLGARPAAGKTGTSENFFDSWFVGFTPQMATAVWMGYGDGGATLEELLSPEGEALGSVGSPTIIWQNYMQALHEDEPIKRFEGIDEPQSPMSSSGGSSNGNTPGPNSSTGSQTSDSSQGSSQGTATNGNPAEPSNAATDSDATSSQYQYGEDDASEDQYAADDQYDSRPNAPRGTATN
jgi:penicillin-binding protein 1A